MRTTIFLHSAKVFTLFSQMMEGCLKQACLAIFIVIASSTGALAQQSADYDIHANIIYRFTKYVNWPGSKKSGDFIIGVVGDSPLTDALKTFTAGKTAGSRKIIIKRFASSAGVFDCHILFISEEESGSLKKIVLKTAGNPVLIVTEATGFAQKGACINFAVTNDHLKLEINKYNIEQRDLDIASELLQLGTVVK